MSTARKQSTSITPVITPVVTPVITPVVIKYDFLKGKNKRFSLCLPEEIHVASYTIPSQSSFLKKTIGDNKKIWTFAIGYKYTDFQPTCITGSKRKGEPYAKGAKRELEEETGLCFKKGKTFSNVHNCSDRKFKRLYTAKASDLEAITNFSKDNNGIDSKEKVGITILGTKEEICNLVKKVNPDNIKEKDITFFAIMPVHDLIKLNNDITQLKKNRENRNKMTFKPYSKSNNDLSKSSNKLYRHNGYNNNNNSNRQRKRNIGKQSRSLNSDSFGRYKKK